MSVRKDEIHVATLRELAEAHVEIARLTKALDEREADMHMRIRAGYDKTVADAWRAEVAKRDAEIADLRALVESQRRDYLDVRLTAELAAARAIATAATPPPTVGGLLATTPVGAIVEWLDGDGYWHRMKAGDSLTSRWYEYPPRWSRAAFGFQLSDVRLPARIVDDSTCDASPESRGPLPKGG